MAKPGAVQKSVSRSQRRPGTPSPPPARAGRPGRDPRSRPWPGRGPAFRPGSRGAPARRVAVLAHEEDAASGSTATIATAPGWPATSRRARRPSARSTVSTRNSSKRPRCRSSDATRRSARGSAGGSGRAWPDYRRRRGRGRQRRAGPRAARLVASVRREGGSGRPTSQLDGGARGGSAPTRRRTGASCRAGCGA